MIPVINAALIEDPELPAFEKLYKDNKTKAYHIAFEILKIESLSEDCVSETFLAIANNFQKVNNLKPYEQQKYIVIAPPTKPCQKCLTQLILIPKRTADK